MLIKLLVWAAALLLAVLLLARYAGQKLRSKLGKAGVKLSWGSITSTSISRIAVVLEQGPLQSLTDVKVELKGQGLMLQLRKAVLQWSVPEEQGTLNGTLLLQDFVLSSGSAAGDAAASSSTSAQPQSPSASVQMPVAQLGFGVGASRGGPLPISCTQLTLQVAEQLLKAVALLPDKIKAAAAQPAAQAGLLAVAAAAVGNIAAHAAAPLPLNPVERLDSFSFLAAGELLSPVTPVARDSAGSPLRLAASVAEAQSGGLPPVSRSSCSGSLPPQQQQQKPVLALEARLQDVAVQLSVCDHDALQVQLELVKYSSVLEQAVLEKLRFSINERPVVQVPHLALHQLPGWLPPGTAAAAAACSMQRSSSPLCGSSLDAAGNQRGHIQQQQQYDCSASTESIRYFDDGGVQSWQSIDDPVPSASLGSRRPSNLKDAALYQRQAARQQAARERCKVPDDAATPSTSSSSHASSSISFGRSNDGAAAASGAAAAAAGALVGFEVYAERVLLDIPHDEAPGRIIVVCETWAKAVKPVLAARMAAIKASVSSLKAAKSALKPMGSSRPSSSAARPSAAKKAKPAYLELSVHVQQVVFSLEQHPLETWLGLHGPVLQAMAAERHLTEQLLASCSSAQGRISRTGGNGAAAGSSAVAAAAAGGSMQTPGTGGKKWQKRRWGSLGRRGAARCRPLHAAADDPYHHSRAVMHVSLARAEAVVLICLPGHAGSAAMARKVVERVDPSSQGVLMERYQSISLDVKLQDIVAHFGGVEEMAATIGSVGASGLLIRARQVCAPPQTRPMRMAVGLWHEADAQIVVKGTRPPMKMYTDVKAELDDVQGGFCPGLEAPFGQLNIAFKRLVTPNNLNPDGSVPPSVHPGLPWWDMTGYMWRGVASVRLRGLTVVLANTESPHVGLRDEKLALTAATLNLGVAAGRIDLTATKLSAFAHMAAPDARSGDSLLVLPAFHLPLTTAVFNISTKLPGGRSQLFHHAFPILTAPPGPDAKPQEVIDVFSMMKCEGWSLGIDIAVNSDRTPSVGNIPGAGGRSTGIGAGIGAAAAAGLGGAGPAGVAAACWHYYQPYNLPHAFIGEFQMKYIIDAVDTLVNPSAVVRLSRKLKPFYVRDRSAAAAAAAKAVAAVRAQIVAMPLLKQQVEIALTADVFRVHHDAQDAEDPSDMVYIALSSVRYMNTFTYSRYRRTQQFSNGSRLKDSMRQFMASLSVEAYDMKIIKPQGDELSAMLGGSAAAAAAGAAWGSSAGLGTPAGGRRGGPDHLDRVRQGYGAAAGASGQGSPSRGSPLKGSRLGNAGGAAAEEEASDLPGFNQGLIAAAACFLLRQAPADSAAAAAQALQPGVIPVDPPPIPKRPIRMIAQDVKLLCPGELRDTCMLLFHHIQKSFSGIAFGQPRGPTRISTQKNQQQQQSGESGGGSGSPKAAGMARSRSDGAEALNLSRNSTGAASAGATQLQRHGSGEVGSAAGAAQGGQGSGSSSMVSSVFDEELMLQRILQENRAAAEAAAAAAGARDRAGKQRRPRSAGDLAACSTSSVGSDTAAADDYGAAAAAAGAGHAAVAVRAVKGPAAAGPRAVTVVAGADDESPRSVHSDDGSRASVDSSGSGSPRAQQQQSSGGKEEVLLEYEIEFVQVQVNLVSDNARGSLVLGTNSALLMGHLNPARLERSVSFKMDQVQAHVMCSEGNPQQAPLWLEIANGKLATPAGAESIMRQVLLPFKCQLVTTKQAANSATAAALNGGPVSGAQMQIQPPSQQDRNGRRSSSSGLPAAGFAASAAQELRLHVPAIGARLDSRQFEVLVDVIQNIAMAPLPTFPASVRGMCRNPDGMSEDDDNQDVQYALETLQSLRASTLLLQQQGLPGGLDSLVLVSERQTVVWWAQEQLQGALDAIAASRVVLALLRNEAGLLKVRQRDSMGVSLTVDTIDWALSKGNTVIVQGELQGITYQSIRSEDHTGTTKIQLHTATFRDPQQQAAAAAAAATAAEATPSRIGRSSLTSLSQYIHGAGTGGGGAALDGPAAAAAAEGSVVHSAGGSTTSSSLAQPVQCLTPRELGPSAAAAAAAAEEAGIILAPWNPDESWERDELVRIYAIHGALEKRHVVYEHIEVLVHPIRVHLTAALAAALQDYFNLKDEDSKLLPGAAGKGGKGQPEAANARGGPKPAGVREDKRRQTAPGDLAPAIGTLGSAGVSSSAATPGTTRSKAVAGAGSGSSSTAAGAAAASPGVGPLTASAPRRPSIFSRRVAAAAASAGASPLSSDAAGGAGVLGSAQPQIVVPPLELDTASVHSLEQGRAGAGLATPVDSPATEAGQLPVAGLAAGSGADDAASLAVESVMDAASCYAASGSSGGAAAQAAGLQLAGAAAAAAAVPASPGAIKFKHVRFNRVNARLTYEGPPLSISGFGLVLDNRVYRNIDGGWTTVLNRYKWDAIRSLVKSVSGLQARKLQELQIPTFSSEPPDTLELRASSGFRAGLLSLLKGRRPAGGRLRLHGGDSGLGLDEAELAGLREGSAGGEDGASTAGDSVLGGGNDYLDLMRDALRAKHKQKKVALLLGNVPPPPPPTAAAAAVLAA
ncbi:hypothetical protein OEZ85_010383 [Tetradesmus obliquus]|uniref:FMP27 GFWDK domain-containing protein n=1 Tax=Tetradesmus obliquus TaxID=3088 RepID=A0ABY8TM41_TETOB|nr:hypothetical protein OEZ85_010383 [Tetradesmus obliquus]